MKRRQRSARAVMDMLDSKDPLVVLADTIKWSKFEDEFAQYYSKEGRPAKLYLLKQLKFFTKLPKRFKIKTPLGSYNPDFAIIKHDDSEGSFIIETKGSDKKRDSRAREDWQMEYAKKHFKLIDLKYKNRITNCKDI